MRTWKTRLLILTIAAAAWAPATASAAFQHVVSKGETLSSVAAADGLSISQLAAANGMSPDSQLVAGSLLAIPPQDAAAGESAGSFSAAGSTPGTASPIASSTGGVYEVRPGDTLTAIAARLGVSMNALAAANGLDPSDLLISGTTLHVSGASAPATTEMVSTTPAAGAGAQGAQPTSEMTSASEVGSIAAGEDVSPSL
ncbi:MAG: LysM peptidoglycan-binding domain-containing protein, partial [Solirubrobacteraceae bacterium]